MKEEKTEYPEICRSPSLTTSHPQSFNHQPQESEPAGPGPENPSGLLLGHNSNPYMFAFTFC